MHLGQDAGNRHRMADIRLAAAAHLALVCGVAETVGVPDLGDVFVFKVLLE